MDVIEAGQQVGNMRRIYSLAEQTLIWLGPDPEGMGRQALTSIGRLSEAILETAPERPSSLTNIDDMPLFLYGCTFTPDQSESLDIDWKAIHWLFQFSWFTRLWVI